MKQLPIEYINRMKSILNGEYDEYINALNENSIRAFRVNTNKISIEEFDKINDISKDKIPYVNTGYYFDASKIGGHPFHHAGIIYVQEPGAMAPVECIDINPDWNVLDMCASPGGKSSQIKNKLNYSSVLVSNEIIPSRCKILTGNIERLGLKNTVTTCCDTARLASAFPHVFDLVCVDAPCSGEGMFRKDDTAIEQWSEDNVNLCAERQKEILENASICVKNGGYIIYATCTFSIEENEKVIDEFLNSHPDFELTPVKKSVKEHTSDGINFVGCKTQNISECRRFYPHKSKGEGQFMAVLKNKCEKQDNMSHIKSCLKKADDKILFDFLDDTLEEYDKSNVLMYKDTPVYFTPDFPVPSGIAFSCGITIGEIKKNYILPHHQFYMSMGKSFKRILNFSKDDILLKKYLHGESVPCECKNGYTAVMCEGCTTGGGKTVNGVLKNHYPKGLRAVE